MATKRPPPDDREELLKENLRLRAQIERARRAVREGDSGALVALGLKRPPGRPKLSTREKQRLADLFVNMTTAPGPYRPVYARNVTHLDLLFEHALGEDLPPEATFEPDTDVPMTPEDALRNIGLFLGLAQRARVHDLLADIGRTVRPLTLPPRRAGAKTRRVSTPR